MLLALPIFTLLMAPLAFGEEWGWRGYLLPHLLPLGQWPAFLIGGVIWGLWHIPVVTAATYAGVPALLAVGLFVGHDDNLGHPAGLDAPSDGQCLAGGDRPRRD